MDISLFFTSSINRSWLATVDGRVKLLFLVVFSFVTILFESPAIQMALFLLSLVLLFSTGSAWPRFKSFFLIFCPVTLFLIGFVQGVFYPGARGSGFFSWDGFFYGLIQALRVLAITTAGFAVLITTPSTSLLYSLRRIGLPYEICFITALAFRLIPVIFQEAHLNLLAQRARGFDFSRLSLIKKIQVLMRTGETIFLNSIHNAGDIALAVDLRGFRAFSQRTFTNPETMNTLSWLVFTLIVVAALLALVAYGLGWGKYLI